MKIYFDNCCLNRPFDDQLQLRIKLETEAKLKIQEEVRAGNLELAWSYILDFENDKNPYLERRTRIGNWRKYGKLDIQENSQILEYSRSLHFKGFRKIDALHISCAIFANCNYFLTTDDKILNKSELIDKISIDDPIGFIKKELS